MKRFFKFLGRTLILWVGCYFLGMIFIGFFPTQTSTCNQLFTACYHRVSSWAPFIGTILENLEIAWNWVHGFLPHFGTMLGTLIAMSMFRWACRRKERAKARTEEDGEE